MRITQKACGITYEWVYPTEYTETGEVINVSLYGREPGLDEVCIARIPVIAVESKTEDGIEWHIAGGLELHSKEIEREVYLDRVAITSPKKMQFIKSEVVMQSNLPRTVFPGWSFDLSIPAKVLRVG